MTAVPPSHELRTRRCRLGIPRVDDAPRVLACVTDPRFPRELPWKTHDTLEAVEARLADIRRQWTAGEAYVFAVRGLDAEAGLLGHASLTRGEGPETWALAFWIDPDQWNRGYATEAAGAVVRFGFQTLCAERIWAGAATWNIASQRVLANLRMRHFRRNPEGYRVAGRWVPTEDFELLAI